MITQKQLNEMEKVLPLVSSFVTVLHTQEQYDNAVRVLDELMEKIGDDENHPLASLMEILGTLIENYESSHFQETASDPVGTLKFLMKEHGVKQGDLSEIGSQGVVSEILKGRRELNVRQIKALSHRFNVSPAVFVQQKMVSLLTTP
jgi:HTH-type transcriptional regulator/antitoxin HigA